MAKKILLDMDETGKLLNDGYSSTFLLFVLVVAAVIVNG